MKMQNNITQKEYELDNWIDNDETDDYENNFYDDVEFGD